MAEMGAGREIYPELRKELAPQLPGFLVRQRWFGGKARRIRSTEVTDVVPIQLQSCEAFVLMIKVTYEDKTDESYAMPVLRNSGGAIASELEASSLRLSSDASGSVVLTDALKDEEFLRAVLGLMQQKATARGEKGELRALQTTAYSRLSPSGTNDLRPKPVGAEQSNSSIIYGHQLILKFFRRMQEGINPDLEIGKFLTEKTSFANVPHLAGSLVYHSADEKQMVQGILQQFVPNQGDAWSFTLQSLAGFYDHAAKHERDSSAEGRNRLKNLEMSDLARSSIEPYLAAVEILAQRTAEMHLALSSDSRDPAFAAEPFTMEFQASLERSIRDLMAGVFVLLRDKTSSLPEEWRSKATDLAEQEEAIASRFQSALRHPIRAMRTRIHGDYHLGQVLRAGSDFVIIDFEGEPARPIAERRVKRSPLQDVAGMLRSFHYAAFAPLLGENKMRVEEARKMSWWAESWNTWVAHRFLAKYFATATAGSFLPESEAGTRTILELHLLEKAIYELGYELNNRPNWVGIPLQGISKLLSE